MPSDIELGWPFVVSPDGNHIAWAERVSKWLGFECVVYLDGAEAARYKVDRMDLTFSPDSRKLLCNRNIIGIGETEADQSGVPLTPSWSGDRSEEATWWHYMAARGPIASPDGKRVAEITRKGRKWCVVVDGTSGKEYDEIIEGTLQFSPDGRRTAYAARDYKKRYLVVDGVEVKQYDEFMKWGVAFSPDSKHVACAARRYKSWVVWVDGAETKEYDSLLPVGLFFDAPDRLRFWGVRGWDGAGFLEIRHTTGGTHLKALISTGMGGWRTVVTRPGTISRVEVSIGEE